MFTEFIDLEVDSVNLNLKQFLSLVMEKNWKESINFHFISFYFTLLKIVCVQSNVMC